MSRGSGRDEAVEAAARALEIDARARGGRIALDAFPEAVQGDLVEWNVPAAEAAVRAARPVIERELLGRLLFSAWRFGRPEGSPE